MPEDCMREARHQLLTGLQESLEDEIYRSFGMDAYCVSDELLTRRIDQFLLQCRYEKRLLLQERMYLRTELYNTFRGFGMISRLLDDASISEIMINNDGAVYYEQQGKLHRYEKCFSNRKKLEDMIQKMVAYSKRSVNESSPIVDARLPDGSRVNIVLPPVAIDAPVVTIRKFPDNPYTVESLIANGTLTEKLVVMLRDMVQTKKNIFIFGGTGSGKTTLLNVMAEFIGEEERVITVEDSAELQIRHVNNLVRMEARQAGESGLTDISIRDMIKSALRMRPDRIVVGEVRGAETFDMLNAMNTGHEGSISTGHANSAQDMLMRMEMMILSSGMEIPLSAIQRLIVSALDYLVEIRRFSDGSRKVSGVYRILGCLGREYELERVYEVDVEDRDMAEAVLV